MIYKFEFLYILWLTSDLFLGEECYFRKYRVINIERNPNMLL